MQNYIFLEKNSELLQKVPVLEDFLSNFTVPFPPPGAKSASPPGGIIRIPPPAGLLSTPLLQATTVPTYGGGDRGGRGRGEKVKTNG